MHFQQYTTPISLPSVLLVEETEKEHIEETIEQPQITLLFQKVKLYRVHLVMDGSRTHIISYWYALITYCRCKPNYHAIEAKTRHCEIRSYFSKSI